jgi:glycosyltransferase involved in cell wall biosynthesis
MSIARQRGAQLHLDVYGDGEELPKYRLLADELQLSAEVRFHGAVPYGPQLLAGITAADVMVVTNLVPELSRNLLQAMSRGVPLVAYRNPGHDALLERSGAAILVPSGDIGELANAFVGVTQNREQLTGMAARGLDTARSLTLDACHRKRMELVVSMLSRSSRSVA